MSDPRKGWLAALLTLSPGLGHLYVGRLRATVIVLLSEYAVVIACGWLFFTGMSGVLVAIGAFVLWRIAVAIHAWRAAQHPAQNAWRPSSGRLMVACIGLFIFNVVPGWELATAGLRSFGRTFSQRSTAMEHTLLVGEFVAARPSTPADLVRDELIVYTSAEGFPYAHRVVALGGDRVEMRDGVLLRNGSVVVEPYAWRDSTIAPVAITALSGPEGSAASNTYTWGPVVVPPHHFLVLGDNRGASLDSRFQGFLPESSVTHRPLFVYFSIDETAGIRWSRLGARLD